MNFKNIKQFLVFLLIDFIFLFCLSSFVKFMLSKIQNYLISLQSLNLDFSKIEETLMNNASNLNLDLFGSNLEILNQAMQKIFYYSIYALIGIFLLYCVFQAVQWNLVCNKLRFKNFGKYLLKFILVNIPILFILSLIFYGILYNVRGVVFNSWIEETYLENQLSFGGSIPALIIFSLLFLVILYLAINLYILMNKYKLKESIIQPFYNLKSLKLLKFVCYVFAFLVLLFTMRINVVLCFILVLSLIEIFRIDFSRILK